MRTSFKGNLAKLAANGKDAGNRQAQNELSQKPFAKVDRVSVHPQDDMDDKVPEEADFNNIQEGTIQYDETVVITKPAMIPPLNAILAWLRPNRTPTSSGVAAVNTKTAANIGGFS